MMRDPTECGGLYVGWVEAVVVMFDGVEMHAVQL